MAPQVETPIRMVLLDIEGTVTTLSFVKDVLFPFCLAALPEVIAERWDSPDLASYRAAFPAGVRDSPGLFEDHVRDLVARDVKAPYLKSLQGYIWKDGYSSGQVEAPLFADVEPALSRWHDAGIVVAIYSSGSVDAQRLFWANTNAGRRDLTPIIDAFFDTVNAGPKTQAESYSRIASGYPAMAASQILFLTDNVAEVDAALAAGMQSLLVQRPGNAPIPPERTPDISDFGQIPNLS